MKFSLRLSLLIWICCACGFSLHAQLPPVQVSANSILACNGGQIQLNATSAVLTENFDPITSANWTLSSATVSSTCGSVSGNALFFSGSTTRQAATAPVNVSLGGEVSFHLKISTGVSPCEMADAGENVVLEYSVNNGATYIVIATYLTGTTYQEFTPVTAVIPAAAQTTSTRFRWRQVSDSGTTNDTWAIDDVTIEGSSDLTYTWTPSTGLSNPNIANPVATITSDIVYNLLVSDGIDAANYTLPLYLTLPPATSITSSNGTFFCEGFSTNLTASPGIGYLWSTNETTPFITVADSGDYSVTVDYGFGCTSTSPLTHITVNPLPNAVIVSASDTAICNGSVVTMTAFDSPLFSYQWYQNGIPIPAATGNTFSTGDGGEYAIGVTDENQCFALSPAVEIEDINPVFSILSDSPTACPGGEVQLQAQSTSFYESFDQVLNPAWAVVGGVLDDACGSLSGNALYFDGSTTRTVRTGPLNVVSGGQIDFYLKFGSGVSPCEQADPGESVVIEYSINGGTTFIVMDNYDPTEALGSFVLFQVPIPPAAQTLATIFRWRQVSFSGSGTDNWSLENIELVSASTGLAYQWSPATGLSSDVVADPIATINGTITYTLTVSNGVCSKSEDITINAVNPPSTIISAQGPLTFCDGESVVLQASSGVAYLWSNGDTLQSINATAAGNYNVFVDYGFGCSSISQTLPVSVNSLPQSDISFPADTTICNGNSVLMEAPLGFGYNYQWFLDNAVIPGAVSVNHTSTEGGIYTLEVTDLNGCVGISAPAEVLNLDPVFSIFASSDEICQGGSAELSVNSAALNENFDPLTPGVWVLSGVSVGNGCGSYSGNALYFDGNTPRTATTSPLAVGAGATVSFFIKSGTGLTDCETPDSGENLELRYSLDGVTYVNMGTYSATGNYTTFTEITVNVPVAAQSPNTRFRWVQTSSSGTDYDVWMVDQVSISGPASNYTYQWSPAAGLTSTTGTTTVATPSSSTTYTVTANNAGCIATDNVTINVVNAPVSTITASGATVFCDGGSVTLTASAGETYLWSNGLLTQSITVNQPGNYSVTVDYGFGCSSIAPGQQVIVNDLPLAQIDYTGAPGICDGNPYPLVSSEILPGYTYTWLLNGVAVGGTSSSSYNATTPGNYTLQIINDDNCVGTSSAVAVQDLDPIVTATSSTPVTCVGGTVVLSAVGTAIGENFDPINSANWVIAGGVVANYCGSVSGNALYFDGSPDRFVRTLPLNTVGIDVISFYLEISADFSPCEMADSGEGISLQYSLNNGNSYSTIVTYQPGFYDSFTQVSQAIPAAAQANGVIFRFIQLTHSGQGADNWSLDNISINGNGQNYTYAWSPATGLSSASVANPVATINATTTYTVVVDNNGCSSSSSVTIGLDDLEVITSEEEPSCATCCDGQILTFVNSDYGPFEYLWSPVPPNGQGASAALDLCVGTYIVTVIDGIGCSDATVVNLGPVGLDDVSNESDYLDVYPNPASETVTVKAFDMHSITEIAMLDITGKVVVMESLNVRSIEKSFDLKKMSSGVYFIRLTNAAGDVKSRRLVVE